MSLQLVLGSSGSGKSEYMYRRLTAEAGEHPKKNYLVIVPEQFTMQTQQKLVDLAPNHAIMNIDVLSFKRLAYRVFDELGCTDIQVLEETGKNLVLRRLAQEQEEKLTVLRANMNRMGYIGEVKSLISELVQYNVSPELLLAMTERDGLPPVLAAKLKDIVVMYQAFQEFMRGTCITAEEILHVLKSLAADSAILRDSVIVLDEFTGFTPIQNDLLRELLQVADVMVALTIDGREDFYHSRGEEELFDLTKKTIRTLLEMSESLRVEVLEPVVLSGSEKKRFKKAPALAFLEQNLFRPYYQRMHGEVREIHLATAKNPREELTWVAREISRLVRSGCRYREIAVVTSAVENYRSYVEALFAKYEIPFFMDTTREVLFHPFIEFVRAALEIIESGYSYTAMMRFLRCGFCGVGEHVADMLDNYLLATGIRGRAAWNRRFVRMPKQPGDYELEELEAVREKICGLLEPLDHAFSKKKATVSDAILALYGLMRGLDIEGQLWEREQELLAKGEQARSREYGQIYRIVMELFEKYYRLLGEEPLSIHDFTEVLEAGLSAAEVAVLPPGYDSVTIGDIERTRLNYTRILFFVGVNDGIVPKSANAGGIISEYERELLAEHELTLAPSAREQAFIQRFYLYRNLTKPSEQLYISYARVDSSGKAIRPSYLIGVIRRMFPDLPLTEHGDLLAEKNFYTKSSALDYLICGERDGDWYALAKSLKSGTEAEREMVERLLAAPYLSCRSAPISRAIALALYGRRAESSVTRLERFAACAYAHYLQYGLRLMEREFCRFESVDMGNIYHTALERYSRKLAASPYDWFTVPDETREELARLAMEEAAGECPYVQDTAESAYQAKRMLSIFQGTVWALTKQVRAGQFIPEKFEVSFRALDGMDSLTYPLENGVQIRLSGRIDRVDYWKDEGLGVKIIDYKSGAESFDLFKLYHGLQLQLLVYMNAALELGRRENAGVSVFPAGILYYHIDDPVLAGAEDTEHELLMALRPDGLVNRQEEVWQAMDGELSGKSEVIPVELKKSGELSARSHVASTEEFELLGRYVQKLVHRELADIYSGDVRINPCTNGTENSCSYCPYAGVCGIDSRIPGYERRRLKKLDKEELMERIETETAKQEAGHGSSLDERTAEGHRIQK
ncbi:MAG: PD-(D/E)XK nuclease family protein [Muribaculaceae bacterium]|nr:PD-(D/E)XK nuclease family protein [Muribaculaceae bacterium]